MKIQEIGLAFMNADPILTAIFPWHLADAFSPSVYLPSNTAINCYGPRADGG
jgi:hypothetical protein